MDLPWTQQFEFRLRQVASICYADALFASSRFPEQYNPNSAAQNADGCAQLYLAHAFNPGKVLTMSNSEHEFNVACLFQAEEHPGAALCWIG